MASERINETGSAHQAGTNLDGERVWDCEGDYDEYVRYMLKAVVNHGIDEGVFNDADADHVTRSLVTIVDGARTRTVVLDDFEALEMARQTAREYVDAMVR